MKCIGNYSNWIKPEWIEYMMTHSGTPGPSNKVPETEDEHKQFEYAKSQGYDIGATYWYYFKSEELPFDIAPPIPTNKYQCWFVKQHPGQFMPMHFDQDFEIEKIRRYWMPVTDYANGHVLLYEKSLITDYKKGDLFLFDNPHALHGSCNIGGEIRITFNIDIWD